MRKFRPTKAGAMDRSGSRAHANSTIGARLLFDNPDARPFGFNNKLGRTGVPRDFGTAEKLVTLIRAPRTAPYLSE